MRCIRAGFFPQAPRRASRALNLRLRFFACSISLIDLRQPGQARASKFYGGENRELVRVIQVALNITDRICSDDGEVAIKPGANGVPK